MTSKRKTKRPTDELTMAVLADAYAAEMERAGKSAGTIASYRGELVVAMQELGAETPIASLTAERVGEYFTSDRVCKLKSGRGKSPLSIAKTCRVLRLALAFAADQKWIESAPLPVAKEEPKAEAVA
jgi:hypothetical protein